MLIILQGSLDAHLGLSFDSGHFSSCQPPYLESSILQFYFATFFSRCHFQLGQLPHYPVQVIRSFRQNWMYWKLTEKHELTSRPLFNECIFSAKFLHFTFASFCFVICDSCGLVSGSQSPLALAHRVRQEAPSIFTSCNIINCVE